MKFHVDRKRPISIRQQIRGAIEHEISFGGLPIGAPLPSVRELAERAGVAPMTVSKIYAELQAEGLIEARSGAGTFVANSPLAAAVQSGKADVLRGQIDALIDQSWGLGMRPDDLVAMVNARVTHRMGAAARKRIAMVGLFVDATASYAERVASQLGVASEVTPYTIGAMRENAQALDAVRAADLVLTFSTLQADVEAMVPGGRVISLRFIPSEATRLGLASLDPMARVAVVSRFAEFQPILTLGVRRFAAHVQDFVVLNMDDPNLPEVLAKADVVVLATGAESVARMAPMGRQIIEYRHIPDPGDIDRLVVPLTGNTKPSDDQSRKEAS